MSKLTRRQFVGATGAALVGTALTSVLPAGIVSAAQTPTGAKMVILKKGPLTIHTMVSPDMSISVTSHIIETPKSLVIVDAQLMQTFAKELRTYAESLKKPIAQIILTHQHPDHWFGANLFKDIPFTATPVVTKAVQDQIDSGAAKDTAAKFGAEGTPEPRVPDGKLTLGAQSIDGLALELEVRTNAESPEELVIKFPEANTIIVQDLVYNGVHFWPGTDRKNWLTILETLRTLKGYDTMLVGHGMPTSPSQIDHAIEYLTFVNATAATATKAEDISGALAKRYPSYTGGFVLGYWPQFFPVK